MKKLLALAAAITLLCTAALAEFDFYALKDTPDAMTYTCSRYGGHGRAAGACPLSGRIRRG